MNNLLTNKISSKLTQTNQLYFIDYCIKGYYTKSHRSRWNLNRTLFHSSGSRTKWNLLKSSTFQKPPLQQKNNLILYQRLITKSNFKYESSLFKNCLEVLKERNNDYNFPLPISLPREFSRKNRAVVFFLISNISNQTWIDCSAKILHYINFNVALQKKYGWVLVLFM